MEDEGLYMQKAGERASGMQKASEAAALSSKRNQAESRQMRNHSKRCRLELDKAEDRAQRRSEDKSNQLAPASKLAALTMQCFLPVVVYL